MKSNRFIFFIALVVSGCTAEMHYTLINYNNGEFKYAPMIESNQDYHIYITGRKNDLKDTYKLEKFCLYYAQKYGIKLTERDSRTMWLMSKEYFSMDEIHEDNFIARVTIMCVNNNLEIIQIALLECQNRDYPVLYPPQTNHEVVPCR
ncbi:MAG: hypothetical protein IPO14_02095 [Saprospiraceae bacterium]|nr:hypothetical protein [Saprospiraceae bacterium]